MNINTKQLWVNAKNGCEKSRNELILSNIKLVYYTINKYFPLYKDKEELESIGTIALINSVDRFKPELGFAFSNYAITTIKLEITKYITKEYRNNNKFSSEEEFINLESQDDFISQLEDKDLYEKIKKIIMSFKDENQRNFFLLYFYSEKEYKQNEIAKIFNVKPQTVSISLKRGLKKIKEELDKEQVFNKKIKTLKKGK